MKAIPERDWKKLRAMQGELLNIACERILEKVRSIASDRERTPHEAYLELWKLLPAEDKEVAIMFDGVRRSIAIEILAVRRHKGLLTDERLAAFSEETQETIRRLDELRRSIP